MRKLRVARRTLLRGIAYGGAIGIGLPVLDIMLDSHGKAYADGTPLPKRFGVFFWGNGVRLSHYMPASVGDYALSEALQPLADVKDYVSVASGFDIKTGNERGHHAGCVGILSGAPMVSQDPMGAAFASTFSAPSIDQVVASAVGQTTRFRSLEVGVAKNVTTGEGTTLRYLSHNGPDNPNPPEYSPLALYTRVFGMGFAYKREGAANVPLLKGRKMLSVTSSGAPTEWVIQSGAWAAMRTLFDGHFAAVCGLEVVDHIHFGGVTPGIRADSVTGDMEKVRKTFTQRFGAA